MTDVQVADTQEIATRELSLDEKRDRIDAITANIEDLKKQLHIGIEGVPCGHCGAEVGIACKTKLRKPTKSHNERWTALTTHQEPLRGIIHPLDTERWTLQEGVTTEERRIKRADTLQTFLDTCTSKAELLVAEADQYDYRVVRATNTLGMRIGYTLEKQEVQQVIDAGITVHVEKASSERGVHPMFGPWMTRW